MSADAPELRTRVCPTKPNPRKTSNCTPSGAASKSMVWSAEEIPVSDAVSKLTIQSKASAPLTLDGSVLSDEPLRSSSDSPAGLTWRGAAGSLKSANQPGETAGRTPPALRNIRSSNGSKRSCLEESCNLCFFQAEKRRRASVFPLLGPWDNMLLTVVSVAKQLQLSAFPATAGHDLAHGALVLVKSVLKKMSKSALPSEVLVTFGR